MDRPVDEIVNRDLGDQCPGLRVKQVDMQAGPTGNGQEKVKSGQRGSRDMCYIDIVSCTASYGFILWEKTPC